MDAGSITHWIQDLRAGKAEAAEALWRVYYHQLVLLAYRKLRDFPRGVSDEEDVVQSAFHSFCAGAAAGRFPRLGDRDDLWQVLMMLTARKASNQRKYHQRQKRGGVILNDASLYLSQLDQVERERIEEKMGAVPSPEFAAEVAEECQRLLVLLGDETLRSVAIAKMDGYTNDEIAGMLQVKTRTIERKLRLIRAVWSNEID